MRLESLAIVQVRNLIEVQINPVASVNIIYGENAAGKTAILESIYLLSKARSFRTPLIKEVIQHNQDSLIVSANLIGLNDRLISTRIRKSRSETEIKYDNNRVNTASQQAKNVVIQTAIPENTKILTGSPKDRRRWIDWALFHVEHDYLKIWHDYYHALRNRNALLRKKQVRTKEFSAWEGIMAIEAEKMIGMWKYYLDRLNGYYKSTAGEHICAKVVFGIKKSGIEGKDFLQCLQLARLSDIKLGFTQHGPHKADIEFKVQEEHVKSVFSRGQIKLFTSMLSIAQAKLLEVEKQIKPIMLIDDLDSELDKKATTLLIDLFRQEGMQLFITTTDIDTMKATVRDTETALFHVEHGRIKSY